MKRFFYGCLIVLFIFSIAVQLTGCNMANIKSLETSQANIEIPDGWVQLKGEEFSIYLPSSWKGGSRQEIISIIENSNETVPTETSSPDESNKPLLSLWAYDSASTSDNALTNLNVLKVTSDLPSLKDYIDKSYKNINDMSKTLGYNSKIVDQEIMQIGNCREVARTIISEEILGSSIKMAQYIIKNNNVYWILTFSIIEKDFDSNIDIFDKAIQSSKL